MSIELTDREKQVFEMLKLGMSNKQMANRMGISESTVKLHVGKVLKKYGARNSKHLMLSALKHLSPSDIPDAPINDAEPFGWVHMHGSNVRGVVFAKESPGPQWQAVYIKRNKS
jgi:DNA-binding CsgD family transcriptional regulator